MTSSSGPYIKDSTVKTSVVTAFSDLSPYMFPKISPIFFIIYSGKNCSKCHPGNPTELNGVPRYNVMEGNIYFAIYEDVFVHKKAFERNRMVMGSTQENAFMAVCKVFFILFSSFTNRLYEKKNEKLVLNLLKQ